MQLVGMLDSPYVRRVAVTLIDAGVAFRHRPISLFRHIDEFSKLSPLLKAPSLVLDDGTTLVESGVILDYLGVNHPEVARRLPARSDNPLAALRATGVALTVCEKAVQVFYEANLRTAEQRSESWTDRIRKQLGVGLAALEAEIPVRSWIGAEMGVADISVVSAFGFVRSALAGSFGVSAYPRLAAFCDRAEDLEPFRRAPALDGVTAPID
jgi:glutathione S-transferase